MDEENKVLDEAAAEDVDTHEEVDGVVAPSLDEEEADETL